MRIALMTHADDSTCTVVSEAVATPGQKSENRTYPKMEPSGRTVVVSEAARPLAKLAKL
jgi:hypothetical protein